MTECPLTSAVEISVTKDAVKFGTTGDIGSANILCRQNNTVDKVGCKSAIWGNLFREIQCLVSLCQKILNTLCGQVLGRKEHLVIQGCTPVPSYG